MASNVIDGLQSELECCICTDSYQDPVQLSCNHNFCRDCLVQLAKSSGAPLKALMCPICRQKHYTSVEKIAAMPPNIKLRNILQALDQQNKCKPATCDTHSKPHMLYCRTCSASKCLSCFMMDCKNGHDTEELDSVAKKLRIELQAKITEYGVLKSGKSSSVVDMEVIEELFSSKLQLLSDAQECLMDESKNEGIAECVKKLEMIIDRNDSQVVAQQEEIKKLSDELMQLSEKKQVTATNAFSALHTELKSSLEKFEKEMVPLIKRKGGSGARHKKKHSLKKPDAMPSEVSQEVEPPSRWSDADSVSNRLNFGYPEAFDEEFIYFDSDDDWAETEEDQIYFGGISDFFSFGQQEEEEDNLFTDAAQRLLLSRNESGDTATINFEATKRAASGLITARIDDQCNTVKSVALDPESTYRGFLLGTQSDTRGISRTSGLSDVISLNTIFHVGVDTFCPIPGGDILIVRIGEQGHVYVYTEAYSSLITKRKIVFNLDEMVVSERPAVISDIAANNEYYCFADSGNRRILIWHVGCALFLDPIDVLAAAQSVTTGGQGAPNQNNCNSFRIELHNTTVIVSIHHIGWVMAIEIRSNNVWVNKTDCSKPNGMCLDSQGNIFVCDIRGPCVTVLNSNGQFKCKLLCRGQIQRPWSVAVCGDKLMLLERVAHHNLHRGPMQLKISDLIMNA